MRPGSGHERAAPDPRAGWAGASFPHSGDAKDYGEAAGPPRATTAARSGHRLARGRERRAHLVTACGARRPGPLPPGHLRTHRRMKETVETINETRSRNGDSSRRVFATCRGARVYIASGVPGTRRALPSACPRRPPPGADRSGRFALTAWFDLTYLGRDPSRSGPCHRSGFRPRRAGRARPKPPNRSGRKRASRLDRGDGPGVGHLGSRDGYDGITPDPAAAGPQGASSSSSSADIRSDRPSARSLRRSVFRVIPRSRAAWSLLPSVDPSTSGRRSRSRCWCASW